MVVRQIGSFNPELLPMKIDRPPQAMWIHYALQDKETGNRYDDARRLWAMASDRFATVQQRLNGDTTTC